MNHRQLTPTDFIEKGINKTTFYNLLNARNNANSLILGRVDAILNLNGCFPVLYALDRLAFISQAAKRPLTLPKNKTLKIHNLQPEVEKALLESHVVFDHNGSNTVAVQN